MKKIISLALAMVFVLIATLSVSAAYVPGQSIPTDEQINNVADCKWTGGNGKACFGVDTAIATEFYVLAGSDGSVYNFWATYDTDVEEDVISAKFSPKANIGIFFGATDAILTSTNLNGSKTGNNSPTNCDGLQYLFANIKYDAAAGTYTLLLLNDKVVNGKSQPDKANITLEAEVALDKTTYSINDTDDITLKVDFDKAGNIKIYVNGIEAMSKTGIAPYGKKCGVILPTTAYGNALAFAATVNNFTIGEPVTPPAGGNGGEQAPENGDATALYVVLSAVALCATFAVALSRKKRIEE